MGYKDRRDFSELLGKTLTNIEQEGVGEIFFTTSEGSIYKLFHDQYCCERVEIHDVVGDYEDLVGFPLLLAEEVSNRESPPLSPNEDSYTWTYYKLSTINGSVSIRWYGSSNGYYSEKVDFEIVKEVRK